MKCPKCSKDIDHLHYYAYELEKADFWLDGDTETYDNWDNLCDTKGEPEYACPECLETLFTDKAEAIQFLKEGERRAET